MKLILPFPPSVNTYWRHPNKGAFAGKSLISAAGRKFQSAACAAIVEQLRRLPKPTSAPASVEIVLFPPDTGKHLRAGYPYAMNKAQPNYGCRHCCCLQISLPITPGRLKLSEKSSKCLNGRSAVRQMIASTRRGVLWMPVLIMP